MSKRLTLLAAAAVLRTYCGHRCAGFPRRWRKRASDRRRRADVSVEEHRPECRELEGPHHAGRRREGRGPRRHAGGPGGRSRCSRRTNAAFAKLPAGTVDTLVKPENKAILMKVLTYHVVAGRMTAADLMKAVKDGDGMARVKTVDGEDLMVKQPGADKLSVTDAKGDVAMVTIADVLQSNGVIHVIDTVLLP